MFPVTIKFQEKLYTKLLYILYSDVHVCLLSSNYLCLTLCQVCQTRLTERQIVTRHKTHMNITVQWSACTPSCAEQKKT